MLKESNGNATKTNEAISLGKGPAEGRRGRGKTERKCCYPVVGAPKEEGANVDEISWGLVVLMFHEEHRGVNFVFRLSRPGLHHGDRPAPVALHSSASVSSL
jgi:hypothetical protein